MYISYNYISKYILALILIVLCLSLLNCASTRPSNNNYQYVGPKIPAAIMAGGQHDTRWQINTSSLSDRLTYALQKFGKYQIYERASLQRILEEQALSQTGVIDEKTAIKIGQLVGVQKLLLFNITRYDCSSEENSGLFDTKKVEAIVNLAVKIVNTTTGLVETTYMGSGKSLNKQKSFNTGGQAKLATSDFNLEQKLLNDALEKAINDVALQLSR